MELKKNSKNENGQSKLARALAVPIKLNKPDPENETMRAALVRLIAESRRPKAV